MGCFKSKTLNYFKKDIKIEFADKRSQITRLYELLKTIDKQILKLKDKPLTKEKQKEEISLFNKTGCLEVKKRACYFAQLITFIKWMVKVVQVNPEDRRIDYIIDIAEKLINSQDEFILNSLENKVKHLINISNK